MAFHSFFTRRRIAEEALKRSEEEFRSLADGAVTGILRHDRNGNVLFANVAAARLFGYETPSGLFENGIPAHIKNPGDFNRYIAMLDDRGTIGNVEFEIAPMNGANRLILLSAKLTDDVVIASLNDITERRETAAALEKPTRVS